MQQNELAFLAEYKFWILKLKTTWRYQIESPHYTRGYNFMPICSPQNLLFILYKNMIIQTF